MENDEFVSFSEIAKNTGDAVKAFQSIIESILQPRGIDLAIMDGHKKIIEHYVGRDDVDEFAKLAFLSSYKRMVKEYKNCTHVASLALNQISESAKPDCVEDDWFTFFFDKVRLISDDTVHHIWAKILANEVNNPGTFQRSLLHSAATGRSQNSYNLLPMDRF